MLAVYCIGSIFNKATSRGALYSAYTVQTWSRILHVSIRKMWQEDRQNAISGMKKTCRHFMNLLLYTMTQDDIYSGDVKEGVRTCGKDRRERRGKFYFIAGCRVAATEFPGMQQMAGDLDITKRA